MYHPEGETQMLGRDSSQTLNTQTLHHAFGEEEDCQLPKQVHMGDFHAPYVDTNDEEENRSYKSTENVPTKNMKDSIDGKREGRIESRTLARSFIQSREPRNSSIVKSPSELAKKYENKLCPTSNVTQYSENDTRLISRSNTME